jgi:hypothetical protein
MKFHFKNEHERRWDLRDALARRWSGKTPSEAECRELADDRTGAEGLTVFSTLGWLIGEPKMAIALLHKRVRPAEAIRPERLQGLLADLDAQEFDRRDQASTELLEMGEPATAELHKLPAAKLSLEVVQRAKAILELHPGEARLRVRAISSAGAGGHSGGTKRSGRTRRWRCPSMAHPARKPGPPWIV